MAGPGIEEKEPDEIPDARPEAAAEEVFEVRRRQKRIVEALLFATAEPLSIETIGDFVGAEAPTETLLEELRAEYEGRGVNLVPRGGLWAFRTAEDLVYILQREQTEHRPMTRAALETLAVVAYHQPVTRTEIEEIRGVTMNKGVLNVLLEAGFIRMRGRRRTPGRPVTYGTTPRFLDHFSLENLSDLPGLDELKGAGFLSTKVPPELQIPIPFEGELHPDEDPLDPDDPGEEDDAGFDDLGGEDDRN